VASSILYPDAHVFLWQYKEPKEVRMVVDLILQEVRNSGTQAPHSCTPALEDSLFLPNESTRQVTVRDNASFCAR